jgi:ketosteroid isomerase-like protein
VRRAIRSASLVAAGLIWMTAGNAVGAPAAALEEDSADADRRQIDELVSRLITTFENLDLPGFMACFADDATGFFPAPEPPQLFEGRSAVQREFERVFEGIRQSAKGGPPYFHIVPGNPQIQSLGPAGALVSFYQRNTRRNGRRTLVLRRSQGRWLIVHFHASNVPIPPVTTEPTQR